MKLTVGKRVFEPLLKDISCIRKLKLPEKSVTLNECLFVFIRKKVNWNNRFNIYYDALLHFVYWQFAWLWKAFCKKLNFEWVELIFGGHEYMVSDLHIRRVTAGRFPWHLKPCLQPTTLRSRYLLSCYATKPFNLDDFICVFRV